jgi:hypothetical protein
MGNSKTVSAPHYYTLTEIVDEPTEHDKEQKQATASELDAVYTAKFDLENSLQGKELEVHLPGLSADDVVRLNGQMIGQGQFDLENEWNYEADPLRWPFLPTRYYGIPNGLIKSTGNVLEICLSGQRIASRTDKRFGLTRMISIRERTSSDLQKTIADYDRKMEYFRPISKGPQAHISLSAKRTPDGECEVVVQNEGTVPAAFLILDLVDEGDVLFAFDEGAFSGLLPSECVRATVKVEGGLPEAAMVQVRGLNFATLTAPIS